MSHPHREQCVGLSDEWYTPPHVFEAMGMTFMADVASPGESVTPWIPARRFITENSLALEWPEGPAWMNPPFGGRNGLIPWLQKFFAHGNGVCLTPDRTSAPWWQTFAPKADAILFCTPKIKFIRGHDGKPAGVPAQGTSLMAAGRVGVHALRTAAGNGLGVLVVPEARQ